jgi:hypothetical protein
MDMDMDMDIYSFASSDLGNNVQEGFRVWDELANSKED